jgi:hypothetical protein
LIATALRLASPSNLAALPTETSAPAISMLGGLKYPLFLSRGRIEAVQ